MELSIGAKDLTFMWMLMSFVSKSACSGFIFLSRQTYDAKQNELITKFNLTIERNLFKR